jgi:hypothetical protein
VPVLFLRCRGKYITYTYTSSEITCSKIHACALLLDTLYFLIDGMLTSNRCVLPRLMVVLLDLLLHSTTFYDC